MTPGTTSRSAKRRRSVEAVVRGAQVPRVDGLLADHAEVDDDLEVLAAAGDRDDATRAERLVRDRRADRELRAVVVRILDAKHRLVLVVRALIELVAARAAAH